MKKALVAYFSAEGNTKKAAERIARISNADIFPIEPLQPYTEADLDWRNEKSRSSIEMKDENFRPEIKTSLDSVDGYDVIFIGFPIWWYVEPRIIDTFLESYDLSEKTIVPFFTSGGSGIGRAGKRIAEISGSKDVREALSVTSSTSDEAIRNWLSTL